MLYYAHSKENCSKEEWQLLREHLKTVAELSSDYAKAFGCSTLAYAAGLLHDLGKYSKEFQKRLEGGRRIDHSTIGSQKAVQLVRKPIGHLLAYVICGHHGGLPNGGSLNDDSSLQARLLKKDLPEISAWLEELCSEIDVLKDIELTFRIDREKPGFSLGFLIRMLYSCLVDADSIDTMLFCEPEKELIRNDMPELQELNERLMGFLNDKFAQGAEKTIINTARADILNSCIKKSKFSPGLFSLTVPTGGGKTFSSLAFALNHAVKHKMSRIIYVIPFTSIIEQNAAQFRKAIGEVGVLEHHSNFLPEFSRDKSSEDTQENMQYELLTETWDAPIIVTTSVQFFESLFSSQRSKCRKLHNIANSVIILDEAQSIPTEYLEPCLTALNELVRGYNSSVVLCTATQPALQNLNIYPQEIMDDPLALMKIFKRVRVDVLKGDNNENTVISDEKIANMIETESQALCIVNTRKHAQLLFQRISEFDGAYHLSARMCPQHRSSVLSLIRRRLNEEKTCRVIATQLIEAGVDVDFPLVLRSMAGLDSIAQAAGRCNREGRRPIGQVYVFEPETHGMPKGWIANTASVTRSVLRNLEGEILSLDMIKEYFTRLYKGVGSLDKKEIIQAYEEAAKAKEFPKFKFAEWDYSYDPAADKRMVFIEQQMKSIIIPWDDKCHELLKKIEAIGHRKVLARQLQGYTIQVYPYEYKKIEENGLIKMVGGIFPFLNDMRYYNERTGLLPVEDCEPTKEILIF